MHRWPAVYSSTYVPLFVKNIIFEILVIIVIFSKFSGLFCTCFEKSVWILVYTCNRWCYTSSSIFIPIETLWPTLQPKIGQSNLSALMASDLVHTLILWLSWSLLIFVMVEQFMALWRTKHLKGGVARAPSQRKMFRTFFVHVLIYQFETWHIHLVGGVTRQVRVSFQSGYSEHLRFLHN